jgi:hypothetical protein
MGKISLLHILIFTFLNKQGETKYSGPKRRATIPRIEPAFICYKCKIDYCRHMEVVMLLYMGSNNKSRSQWPRGLRHELFSLVRTLGSWVRILLKAWMSVCVHYLFVLFCV